MTNNIEYYPIFLSVIVPITRMTGRLQNLEKTFQSCEKYQVEIILVHDEQDLTTQNEIEILAKQFKHLNIKIFRETFNSPGLARNFGIKHLTGKWFCFSDADDLPQIYNLLKTAQSADNDDAEVGIGGILIINNKKESIFDSRELEEKQLRNIVSFAKNPAFTRFVFKTEVFSQIDFPEIKMGEDQVYLGRTKFLDKKIYFSDDLLYKYFTNLEHQATKSVPSLSELPTAIELLRQNLFGSSKQMEIFIQAQMIKICFSCLKRRINPLNALTTIFKFILTSPFKSVYILFLVLKVRRFAYGE